jgi:hypothetical protein
VHCNVLVWGQSPDTPRRLGSTLIPGAARALREGPDAFPGKRASLDKALEKPHTRVAEVPRDTPGMPQRLQRRAGREAMSRVGTTHLGAQQRPGGKPPHPGVERLFSAAPATIESPPRAVGGSPRARLATCLVLPQEGDAFETSLHSPCGARMQYAACAQIPGLDAPVVLALPEQRVDLGGSCALKHCSDQLPDRRGQSRR